MASRPSSCARAVSPLLLRILAVNVMALAILVGGLLYLGNYQDRIIEAAQHDMLGQARIVASAIAQNAIVRDEDDQRVLSPMLARLMVRRLAVTTETRTRLYAPSGALVADSQNLLADRQGRPFFEDPPAPEIPSGWIARATATFFDGIDVIHERRKYPSFEDQTLPHGAPYEIVSKALREEAGTQVWSVPKGGLILAVAVPVEPAQRALGAVLMTRSDKSIDQAIYAVRVNILQIFFGALGVTILLSLYLARGIARPIRQLAQAADLLRRGQVSAPSATGLAPLLREDAIPDMTARHDEIGDLSGALRDLTHALARRIGAIEHFAADVAHELKNPMTSLRSAVETAERVTDEGARRKLMQIIRDDVDRMNRLITDIASASRLEAELGRAEAQRVNIAANLEQLAHAYEDPRLVLHVASGSLRVWGVEDRLMQVFRNLIDNALSFTPPEGTITLSALREGPLIRATVENTGPGIPDAKLEAVFDRFYTERPKTEKFGTHSGLGLSISRQIIEAHRGAIHADNIRDGSGAITGARFTVELPAFDAEISRS